MTGVSRLLLVTILSLASVGAAQAGTPGGHILDDAGLFNDETLVEANAQLFEVSEKTRVNFWVRTIKKLPDDVSTALNKTKKTHEQLAILIAFARESAGKDGMGGIYALISDDPKHPNVVVISTNTGEDRPMTDRELDSIRTVFRNELTRSPNAALRKVVNRVQDTLLRRSADSSISWPLLGAAISGLVGLWLLLRALRMRAAQKKGDAQNGATGRRPTHVGGLFGGLFGVVAGHWIYDTLFEQEKTPAAEVVPGQNPLDAPLELNQSETADTK